MKIGIVLPQTGQQATRDNVIELAQKSEKEGFDSLWVFDRLVWPLEPQTSYRGTADGTLPDDMQNVFDPLETLTFVAANTRKIALGTCVIDMLFHNPVILARRFATLDVLSEGRVICGLGIGWSKDEYQASNIPFENRGKRANEFVHALKRIWADDIVELKGEFYNIPPSKIGPKPIQNPSIPIYLGGYNPLPLFQDAGGGSIILNASIGASKGFPATSVYSATKAAIRSFARTWTVELKQRKIRVNAISPGPIETPMSSGADEQLMTSIISTVPMGRMGSPDEIAKAVSFLASDDSSYVTGIELFVDGGMAQI